MHTRNFRQRELSLPARTRTPPDSMPTLDMNAQYGLFFTRSALPRDSQRQMMKDMADPLGSSFRLHSLLSDYCDDFRDYFDGAIPVTFHSHVSDITPQRIVSAIKILTSHAPRPGWWTMKSKYKGLTDIQMQRQRIAVLQGTYGASCGTLAHHSLIPEIKAAASGSVPAVISPESTEKAMRAQLKDLETQGYFAVLVEIVLSDTGQVVDPEMYNRLARLCKEVGLYLVVDEALTAIRCGAPFAHQLPQYSKHKPSFVLFGKGFRTCGLAVYPDGIGIKRMGYGKTGGDSLVGVVGKYIDGMNSEPVSVPTLLHAQAVLTAAREQDWPQRALEIGETLRDILTAIEEQDCQQPAPKRQKRSSVARAKAKTLSNIGGLGSLIYVPTALAAKAAVVGADAGPDLVRWMPYLDEGMSKPEKVQSLFGPKSQDLRRSLLKQQRLYYCGVCGSEHGQQAMNGDVIRVETGAADADNCGELICPVCSIPICHRCRSCVQGHPKSQIAAAVQNHTERMCLSLGKKRRISECSV